MVKLQIGTSGWVYKHWMGIFYPPDCNSNQQLSFYAQHFTTVEINFSFYKLPDRSVFESWREQTPEKFVFAVKGSRYLTHMKKLKDPDEPLSRLMERASGLQEKLGPILFQFPHTWHINIERLQPFLELLQTYPQQQFTVEFRHSSWLIPQVYKLLERAGVALCLPVSPTVPLDVCLTTSWTYIRIHSGQSSIGLSDRELTFWAERIHSFCAQGFDVYVYFNNDPDGHALRDAQRLHILLKSD
ncbi:protein of unknown function DUF72 [Gloeocapsa sp. PCC 7428]|uniref:DUF72 domain-containing protein n=1 Tax=Gloeocapsa sp. PCC 7428 TaxID=1173026 RepID=UPI0002A5CD03|nr:DUF72 domain-containing protein [Gloeocapsa sp. PCC 7428]AFZ31444.1 protein of unknown function DUF72 [Gloeocapsa sp. PCC 7428]